MAINLNVPLFGQMSPMSCWWACMRMIFSYYGRPAPMTPSLLNSQFGFGLQSGTTDPYRSRAQPSQWYFQGIPPEYLGTAADLTGFRIGDREGAWNESNTEAALRRYGPMIFYGVWNGFPHAIVLKGASAGMIFLNDPGENPEERGSETGFSDVQSYDWLNARVSNRVVGSGADAGVTYAPPMYLPDDRPVRATVPT
jgi:hypothetical protein